MAQLAAGSRCRLSASPHTAGDVLATEQKELTMRYAVRWDGTLAIVSATELVPEEAALPRKRDRRRGVQMRALWIVRLLHQHRPAGAHYIYTRRHPEVQQPPQPPQPRANARATGPRCVSAWFLAQTVPGYGRPLEQQAPYGPAEVAFMLLQWDSTRVGNVLLDELDDREVWLGLALQLRRGTQAARAHPTQDDYEWLRTIEQMNTISDRSQVWHSLWATHKHASAGRDPAARRRRALRRG
jgi:hypothetical protein